MNILVVVLSPDLVHTLTVAPVSRVNSCIISNLLPLSLFSRHPSNSTEDDPRFLMLITSSNLLVVGLYIIPVIHTPEVFPERHCVDGVGVTVGVGVRVGVAVGS